MKVFGNENKEEEPKSNLPEQLKGKSAEEVYELARQEYEKTVNSLKAKKFDESQKGEGEQTPPKKGTQSGPSRPGQTPPQGQGQHPTLPKNIPSEAAGGQGQQQGQKPIRYWEDPEGFLNQQLQQRLEPLVKTQVQALRETNRQMFEQNVSSNADDKEFYEEHKDEVQEFMDALNPQIQADPRAYKKAYDYVKSQHLDEIIDKERTKSKTAGLAEALAEAGLDQEQIATIVQKSAGSGATQDHADDAAGYQSSLFQPQTGIPRTASGSQSASSKASGDSGKKRGRQYTQQERKMMEEFGMSAEEWDEYAAENTDMYTNLNLGGQ